MLTMLTFVDDLARQNDHDIGAEELLQEKSLQISSHLVDNDHGKKIHQEEDVTVHCNTHVYRVKNSCVLKARAETHEIRQEQRDPNERS